MNKQWSVNSEHIGYRLVVSCILYGLYMMWPLPWLTAVHWDAIMTIVVVLLYPLVVLLLQLWRLPAVIMGLLYSSLIIGCLLALFLPSGTSIGEGIASLLFTLRSDIVAIFVGQIWLMSSELQTLLLLIGLTMLLPALQQLIWLRQWSYSLVAITGLYLFVIQQWLQQSIFYYMWLTLALGLLLACFTTMQRMQRLLNDADQSLQIPTTSNWLRQVVAVVIIVAMVPLMITFDQQKLVSKPAFAEHWNEQLLQFFSKQKSGSALAKRTEKLQGAITSPLVLSGYSLADHELGAPFQADDQILFYGTSAVETYWRGETKSLYDGRGWYASAEELQREEMELTSPRGESLAVQSIENIATTATTAAEWIEQTITFVTPQTGIPLLTASGQAEVVQLGNGQDHQTWNSNYYYRNNASGALYTLSSNMPMQQYTTRSLLPGAVERERWESSSGSESDSNSISDSDSYASDVSDMDRFNIASYLQLPSALPERVGQLADTVVRQNNDQTRYGQVQAIERYLQQQFIYSHEATAVPPEEADFVDHFLFEQQSGYCVHFSSAMVVMLRTLDIPARWVKGFTPGTLVEKDQARRAEIAELAGATDVDPMMEQAVYEVKQANAHAWVEVYFDDLGWIPFEPTPGYDGALGASEQRSEQMTMQTSGLIAELLGNIKIVKQAVIAIVTMTVLLIIGLILWTYRKSLYVERKLLFYQWHYHRRGVWLNRREKLCSRPIYKRTTVELIDQKIAIADQRLRSSYERVIHGMWSRVDEVYIWRATSANSGSMTTWQQQYRMIHSLLTEQQRHALEEMMQLYDQVKFAPTASNEYWQLAPPIDELRQALQLIWRNQSGIKTSYEQPLHQQM